MNLSELLDRVASLSEPQRLEALRKLRDRGIDLRSLRPPRRAPGRPVPLSPQQEDLWTFEALYPGAALNLCGAYWFTTSVDADALRATLRELLLRHPVLGSRFIHTVDGLVQEPSQNTLSLDLAEVEDLDEARMLIQDHARRPFDLAHDLPIRALLISGAAVGPGVLVLAFHHIVTDWWTFDLLHSEMSAIYSAFLAGLRHDLEPTPDYADFAAWHQDLRAVGANEADEQFWASYLSDPPEPPLPSAGRSAKAERIDVDFGTAALEALTGFARRQGVSTFAAGLAVFAAFLHRQTGVADVVVGTPSANRDLPGTEQLVGYVMNMVPVRVAVNPECGLASNADSIARSAAEALAHGKLPLGRVTSIANLTRTWGQAPAYQVVFMYLPEQQSITTLPGNARFERVHTGDEENGFVVILRESGGRLTATFEFRSNVIDAATATFWSETFGRLLEGLLKAPDAPLNSVDVISDGERERVELLGRGAETGVSECSLPDLIAGCDPLGIALTDGEQDVTYRELDLRASRLADALRRRGVGPGTRVGLQMGRSVAQLVAVLGVLRSGAAYVPLDPAYPDERIKFMAADADLSLVLDDETDLWSEAAEADGPLGISSVEPRSPAYVIYTSGSTGVPKGVVATHRGAVNLARAQARAWGLTSADRVLAFASLSFDTSVEEIWTTWAAGASLVLNPPGGAESVPAFLRFVAEHRITVLDLPTAFWGMLATDPDVVMPPSVRLVVIGGETYSGNALTSWLERHGHIRLINTYGPTECTVTVTATVLGAEDSAAQVIGSPLENVRVHVLDGYGRPVGLGVVGELHVGGPGVALGYLNRPDLTSTCFLDLGGERLYRTGDLVMMRPDGSLVFRGRTDDQVKLRGYRIELGEVESALESHPDVRAAFAVVVGAGESARLVAHVLTSSGGIPDDLHGWIGARLPAHFVPTVLMPLDEVPVGPSGKIDRRRLPVPESSREDSGTEVQPRSRWEEVLVDIWREVLDVDQVGVHDDFFMLGGTSLMAIRATSELERRTGTRVHAAEIFNHRTVAALATVVSLADSEGLMPAIPRRSGGVGTWPMTAAQTGLWYLAQVEEVRASYSIVECFVVDGEFDSMRLESCVFQLVARHEALRTTFELSPMGPVQRVHEGFKPEVLRCGEVASRQELQRLFEEHATRPFDLQRGPLVRLLTARLPDDDLWAFGLCVHHIVADGISIALLLDELTTLYAGDPLPATTLQLADYAVWQQGRDVTDGLTYWVGRMEGAPALTDLPWDRERPPRQRGVGETLHRTISAGLAADVVTFARAERVTPVSVYLTAYQVLLARLSGQLDVVTGIPVTGRPVDDLQSVVGFFINTIPLRTKMTSTTTLREAVAQVARSLGEAMQHQDVPLEQIVSALSPRRSLAYHPLFQTVFSWNEPAVPPDFGGTAAKPLQLDLPMAKFDFGLTMSPTNDDGIELSFEFRTDLLDRGTVERWAVHYGEILARIVSEPDRAVSATSMHSVVGLSAQVAYLEGPRLELPPRTVHDVVESAARLTPTAVALEVEDRQVSFAELDELASHLAARLRGEGVEPGARVGIRLPRSVDLYVAILAVLKTGAAYVPLDPEYPDQRIDFMVTDSGASVVIDEQLIAAEGPVVAPGPVDPASAAYICYTSGSTGVPKGVEVHHSAAANLATGLQRAFDLRPDDRVLQFASISFDAAVADMFATWAAGACLVVVRADRRTGVYLQETLRAGRITVAMLPPSVVADLDPDTLPELRSLITAGEACPPWLVDRWGQGRRLINAYGPTEATVCTTTADLIPGARIVVGAPIINVQVKIVDTAGNVVPVGVVGEVLIAGAGVSRGYLGRPDLTERSFVDGWYWTGDLGRVWPDGSLELLGRRDDQVKVNGFRIELGEVESVVSSHPEVLQAVAAVSSGRLVAHVRTRRGRVPAGLRSWLAAQVPAYMVPSVIQPIDEVPLTPAGKIDRDALPALDSSRPELEVDFVSPRNDTERELARMWSEVLNISRVGVRDNLFELGADSLMVVTLASRIEAAGLPVSVVSLYTNQTIEQLAESMLTEIATHD